MAATFVSIAPKDFRARLPFGFLPVQVQGSREIVFKRPAIADRRTPPEMFVFVFTGIELGAQESRPAGDDAIHVVLMHEPTGIVLISEERVNRVGTVGSTLDRVMDRIGTIEGRVMRDVCPLCHSPMLLMGARGGRRFQGCSGFKVNGCKFTRKVGH